MRADLPVHRNHRYIEPIEKYPDHGPSPGYPHHPYIPGPHSEHIQSARHRNKPDNLQQVKMTVWCIEQIPVIAISQTDKLQKEVGIEHGGGGFSKSERQLVKIEMRRRRKSVSEQSMG